MIVNGLRHWAQQHLQPSYDELPMDEQEEERKDTEALVGVYRHGRTSTAARALRVLTLVPAVLLRLVVLLLRAVADVGRRQHERFLRMWTPVYARLGYGQVLVPSFLQPADAAATTGSPRRLHPSAWLDGLRGVAAFLVVWHHASLLWFSWGIHRGYGSTETDRWVIQLPIVRLLVSGPPNVAIFFVISGYAISYKALRLSRMGRHAAAAEAVQSSIFRRHPRLFLMPLVVSFASAIMIHLDWYGTDGWTGVAVTSRRPVQTDTLRKQLRDWFLNVISLTNPMSGDLERGRFFGYDVNLWTLPIEFDCSMAIFLCQAAFNRLRPKIRMMLMLGLVVYAHLYLYWQMFLFLSGMLLCDLHFHLDGTALPSSSSPPLFTTINTTPAVAAYNDASAPPSPSHVPPPPPTPSVPLISPLISPLVSLFPKSPSPRTGRPRLRLALGLASFFAALFVLSMPEHGLGADDTPGYRTLTSMISEFYRKRDQNDRFWVPIAGVWLVLTIDRVPELQRLFTGAFPQYLGTISYSMYLVHGPLLFTAGHWLVRYTTALTGVDTPARYGFGIALSAAGLWPLIIYFADLMTRTVDMRAVSVGRRVYEHWVDKTEEAAPERRVT